MSAPRALVLAMPPDLVDPGAFRKPGFKRAEIAGEGAFGPADFRTSIRRAVTSGFAARASQVTARSGGAEPNVPMISGQ